MDKVSYKQFYITVRVEILGKNGFKILGSIRPVQDETLVVRSWLEISTFASVNKAYEHGLQNCRAWIDEHVNR